MKDEWILLKTSHLHTLLDEGVAFILRRAKEIQAARNRAEEEEMVAKTKRLIVEQERRSRGWECLADAMGRSRQWLGNMRRRNADAEFSQFLADHITIGSDGRPWFNYEDVAKDFLEFTERRQNTTIA